MKRYMLWNAVSFFWLCRSAAPGDGYLLSEMCTKEEKGEKLSVPNVKVFEENLCYMWKFTVSCSPCCGEKKLFFGGWGGGFDVVVFPKWRICCFWFSRVVHRVIREIICRCSRIILALSSLVRFFFLGCVFSPSRACLTISKCRSSEQASTQFLHLIYHWTTSLPCRKSSILWYLYRTSAGLFLLFFMWTSWRSCLWRLHCVNPQTVACMPQ